MKDPLTAIQEFSSLLASIATKANTITPQNLPTEEWINYQINEVGKPIKAQHWMVEIIDLICDFDRHMVFVGGAAQVGKTLSYLLSIKRACELHQNLRVLLVYPTRGQRDTYPNRQLIPVLGEGVKKSGQDLNFNSSDIILRYANTSKETTQSSGKSVAKASLTSFTADIAFLEEASQITTEISIIDRLNQSVFPAQPMRAIGTFGSGNGIEKLVQTNKAKRIEFLQVCPHCGAENPGSKHLIYDIDLSGRPYNLAFSNCSNCAAPRNSGAWKLDTAWRGIPNSDALFISLPPFIHCVTEEEYQDKLDKLKKRCVEESSVANIYQQGFGIPFSHSEQRINRNNILRTAPPVGRVVASFIGYDHGRRCGYFTQIDKYEDGALHVAKCGLISSIELYGMATAPPHPNTYLACDIYPDVDLVANIVKEAKCAAFLAAQKNNPTSDWDKKISTVWNGSIEYPALFFQYTLWARHFMELVNGRKITFNLDCHELMESHLTSILLTESKVVRPSDHCDDLFFSSIFALLAASVAAEQGTGGNEVSLWQW